MGKMTTKALKKRKKELGLTNAQLAQRSGVPVGTVNKIMSGQTKNPQSMNVEAIVDALWRGAQAEYLLAEQGIELNSNQNTEQNVVKESAAYAVKKQDYDIPQGYTLDDYYALPDDQKKELIDGKFYDMGAPTFIHQRIAFLLSFQFQSFIGKNHGSCVAALSPVDVKLDSDNKTMVQPDFLIICDHNKIKSWGVEGAPDFIVEIASKSSIKKDCLLKAAKYAEAGVREYWIIDPQEQRLLSYFFEDDFMPEIQKLEGEMPVGIYDGELKIDLDELAKVIERGF